MEEMKLKLEKLREERLAREKARIDKLRELNLKKYTKEEKQPTKPIPITKKPDSTKNNDPIKKVDPIKKIDQTKKPTIPVKNLASNRTVSNPIKNTAITNSTNIDKITNIAQVTNITKLTNIPNLTNVEKKMTKAAGDATASVKNVKIIKRDIKKASLNKTVGSVPKNSENSATIPEKPTRKSMIPNMKPPIPMTNVRKSIAPINKPIPRESRKSFIPKGMPLNPIQPKDSRKSLMPKISESKESVFDRLYKPKMVKNGLNADKVDKERVQIDSKFREKLIKQSSLLLNKRHTVFERPQGPQRPQGSNPQVRRSISAVHFKRIAKNELSNCFHKWASSEHIDKLALNGDEDDGVKQDKVVSAIKSDRKKVNFKKPIAMNFNTPKPAELQSRLKEWLQKRGKAIDTYHHLQCFGLHHMAQNSYSVPKLKQDDEENKENIALSSDSDNDSYSESMGQKWRRASGISSNDFNETKETISEIEMHREDDLVIGALNDLTDLLREGFDWEQSARWLRAIRERFPSASELAAYWECRAALEEQQGNLPATVHCWGEAVAKGTERSVVEANLDQLLDKFMQLKISPRSAKKKQINPKLVDVKNVFKSTIIRFAVQQAKIRQSAQLELPKYTITPVRRSGRMSISQSLTKPKGAAKDIKFLTPHGKSRTPLVQICSSLSEFKEAEFVRNDVLPCTP